MEIKSKEQQLKELQENITQLQEQVNKLAKEVVEEKTDDCLIKHPEQNDEFYYLQDENNAFRAVAYYGLDIEEQDMHFADEEQCKCYAEALTTFILLRKQPGSCKIESGVEQCSIFTRNSEIYVGSFHRHEHKLNNICPFFDTYESAQKALDTVGEERIKKMMEYFHS